MALSSPAAACRYNALRWLVVAFSAKQKEQRTPPAANQRQHHLVYVYVSHQMGSTMAAARSTTPAVCRPSSSPGHFQEKCCGETGRFLSSRRPIRRPRRQVAGGGRGGGAATANWYCYRATGANGESFFCPRCFVFCSERG